MADRTDHRLMLFSTKDNDRKPSAEEQRMAFPHGGKDGGHSLQSMKDLERHLGKLERDRNYHYWSRGQWSMHELLEFLLMQTGPADVWLTTWTITENPVRRLFALRNEGIIKTLSCVLDYRIQGRKSGPFQLLEQTADRIKLAQCHAKAIAIANDEWKVSVIGSANFSMNPRLEAGVICTAPNVTQFHIDTITNEMDR